MNLLVLVLLIPFAFAETAPGCGELGQILQDYEKDLSSKFAGNSTTADCRKLQLSDMGTNLPVRSDSNKATKDATFFDKFKCAPLSVIESELQNLEVQEATLAGIAKLKNSIKDSKEDTANSNQTIATDAGKTFVSSLNTAQSLEILLQSQTNSQSDFMAELKKIPVDKRKDVASFTAAIAELCKNSPSGDAVNACDKKLFNPNQDSVNEINALLEKGTPSAEQIQSWKNMLSIRKKGVKPEEASYSFTQMRQEMESGFAKLDKGEKLSRGELKVIQNLDQFENATGLSFVDYLSSAKDKFKNQFAQDRFRFLIEDTKQREEFGIQSKMSLLWSKVKDSLPLSDTDQAICADAKLYYDKAMACNYVIENNLAKISDPNLQSEARNLIESQKSAIDYEKHLSNVSLSCLDSVKVDKTKLESCLNEVNVDTEDVHNNLLMLNFLKEKIGSENQNLMKYRNYALYKWTTQNCSTIDSSIEFCDPDLSISPQASLLSNDMMQISVLATPKPEAEEKAKELCEGDSKKLKNDERLCSFFGDTTPDIPEKPVPKKVPTVPSLTTAPTREGSSPVRDAWINGLRNGLYSIANQLRPQVATTPFNPYLYNYSPYNYGTPPMGVADTLLFNARYYGAYGYYMPTAGYQPYTAFGSYGSKLSSYTAVKSNSLANSSYYFAR